MEVMKSEKGNTLFVVNGFKYHFQKTLTNGLQRWTCYKKSCRCYLKLAYDNSIVESNQDHNHEAPGEKKINRERINNSLKRKAVEDISSRPSKLLHAELREGDVSTLTSNDVSLIKRNIRNARSAVHPNLPRSSEDTHTSLENMKIMSNAGESFLQINDREKSIIVFSTSSNFKSLCDSRSIYVDGTFKSCPKFFTQLFTIHGFIKETYVPLVFCLLPNKETESYNAVFRHVVNCCAEIGLIFNPKEIFIDLEIAIHTAAWSVWPSAKLRGCRFHLGQSWWRKIQYLGLTNEYKSNTENGIFLKYFFGLPFLNPEEVDDCFVEDIMSVQPNDDRIRQFTDYIFETYVSPEATFPPRIWAEFSASTNRTTNSCEAFHSKLNSMFYSAHPNIYNFVDVLKGIQSEVYILLRNDRKRTNKRVEEKETFLREMMTKLRKSEITRYQFLKSVSFKFLPVNKK